MDWHAVECINCQNMIFAENKDEDVLCGNCLELEELRNKVEELEKLAIDLGKEIDRFRTRNEEILTENEHLKQYKKVLMESDFHRTKVFRKYEDALNEICGYVNQVGEPIEVYNIANKALKGEVK